MVWVSWECWCFLFTSSLLHYHCFIWIVVLNKLTKMAKSGNSKISVSQNRKMYLHQMLSFSKKSLRAWRYVQEHVSNLWLNKHITLGTVTHAQVSPFRANEDRHLLRRKLWWKKISITSSIFPEYIAMVTGFDSIFVLLVLFPEQMEQPTSSWQLK